MPALSASQIAELIAPYYSEPSALLLDQLCTYLELLLKWNARTNLSAVLDPAGIVRRHFGESLFASTHLPPCRTLLDFGSGAGFPGLPIALARPAISVTLAESQNKKAAFLREVVRTLGITVEVWDKRVEVMSQERLFDVVTLRAVDNPNHAEQIARRRLTPSGFLLELTTNSRPSHHDAKEYPVPNTSVGLLRLSHMFHVERL